CFCSDMFAYVRLCSLMFGYSGKNCVRMPSGARPTGGGRAVAGWLSFFFPIFAAGGGCSRNGGESWANGSGWGGGTWRQAGCLSYGNCAGQHPSKGGCSAAKDSYLRKTWNLNYDD